MNKDHVKGTNDEVIGSAKRRAGELTDNSQLQVEGMVQQVKGKVENAWGKTKDAARDAQANLKASQKASKEAKREDRTVVIVENRNLL